jgi:hypothetical protein
MGAAADMQSRLDALVGHLLESESPFGRWSDHPLARAGGALQERVRTDPRARRAGALATGLVLGRAVSRLAR